MIFLFCQQACFFRFQAIGNVLASPEHALRFAIFVTNKASVRIDGSYFPVWAKDPPMCAESLSILQTLQYAQRRRIAIVGMHALEIRSVGRGKSLRVLAEDGIQLIGPGQII